VRKVLESHPELEPDTAGLGDAEILARIGATEAHPEGLFFPDTYLFDKRSNASGVLRRAYHAMQQRLDQAWAARDPALPLKTPYEALILASIVEKETGRAEDRGLGADYDGRLRRRHLETDHPWNTYTRGGLPPTPIAMPGPDALLAAVRPQQSEFLYFVSRGDGSSQFSRTLAEHNQAVNRFIRNAGKSGSKP